MRGRVFWFSVFLKWTFARIRTARSARTPGIADTRHTRPGFAVYTYYPRASHFNPRALMRIFGLVHSRGLGLAPLWRARVGVFEDGDVSSPPSGGSKAAITRADVNVERVRPSGPIFPSKSHREATGDRPGERAPDARGGVASE